MKYKSKGKIQKSKAQVKSFQNKVLNYWEHNGRHNLPWRKTKDPYKILVSEIMLQQTQVHRVIPKYREFLSRFPTIKSLADASLIDVLRIWSGLGHNRRAKYLRDTAITIEQTFVGKFPKMYAELRVLPGIGDYTAKAVRVFAFNESEILIETNVRTVFFHHFFSNWTSDVQFVHVHDKQLIPIAERVRKGQDPREWHWALMDYGADLKRRGVKLNARSAHYTKQSKFQGSLRQVRGAILRTYTEGGQINDLRDRYGGKLNEACTSLVRDGLLPHVKGRRLLGLTRPSLAEDDCCDCQCYYRHTDVEPEKNRIP